MFFARVFFSFTRTRTRRVKKKKTASRDSRRFAVRAFRECAALFIHPFAFFLFYRYKFLYLSSRMAKDEWMKRAWKERTQVVRVREFWLAWASFSLFFCFGTVKILKISGKRSIIIINIILVGGTTKTRFKVSVLLGRSLMFPWDGVVDRRDPVPRGSKPLFETNISRHILCGIVLESCNS